jgi:molecular chaperone IbpA
MDSTVNRLFRYGIGLDSLDRFFDHTQPTFPHYNIEKISEDHFRVTIAVAGYSQDDISIVENNGYLLVKGKKEPVEDSVEVIHRGIAFRDFAREWKLGDYVHVKEAKLEHGLLLIDLIREMPEEAKPRQIAIG